MSRRVLFLLAVLVGLVSLGSQSGPRTAAAQPAVDTKITVVRAAYDILLEKFFRPLDPGELLGGGWDALGQTLRRNDLPAPPTLGSLPSDRDAAFSRFTGVYNRYVADLPEDITPLDIAFTVVDGMAESLNEAHTSFLTPAQYRNNQASSGGGDLPVGFGVSLTSGAPRMVTRVAPGGPADRAGILPGDVIAASDGSDLTSASAQEFARATGGPAGTVRVVTVRRGEERLDLTITRGSFYFPPLESRMLSDNVGYLKLDQFVQSVAPLPDGSELLPDFDRRLGELEAAGARALILDLRNNPGGFVSTTAELLARFLPEDALTIVRYDERGRESTGVVSGHQRRVQLPMVLLVNGSSYSASEASAATLRENNRAIIVGKRTGGALATAQLMPLPEGAGLQVGVAEVVTVRERFKIDEVGYPVDIEVDDTRTAADYRAGRDPQLDTAIAAIATAPAPPAFRSTTTGVSAERLRELLGRYLPDPSQITPNDRLNPVVRAGSRTFNHVNQSVGSSARDPLALQATLRQRGWLGGVNQTYSIELLGQPSLDVTIEMYASAAGAASALAANDYPDLMQRIANPIQLGDGTVAYRGMWQATGDTAIAWRRGNVVFAVDYFDAPGFEREETLIAAVRLVDSLYVQNPLPANLPVTLPVTGDGSAE